MTAFIIVLFSGLTGWVISQLTLFFLFKKITGKNAVVIPAVAKKTGSFFQSEFESSKAIDEKIADPLLLEKMKPEIEKHVDFFLNEKLATVFPLLYKFMGEKTLLQFKQAFMVEIDLLFPVIIRNYMSTLKKEFRLDSIIAERINMIPAEAIRQGFYENAKKEIFYFKCMCSLVGIAMGLVMLLILSFL